MRPEFVPTNDDIYSWIGQIYAQGIRRVGYPADEWVQQFCLERFKSLGLENVRTEPLDVPGWEPRNWSLTVWGEGTGGSEEIDVACFPIPYSLPTEGTEARLVAFDARSPEQMKGNIALRNTTFLRIPESYFASVATGQYDPEDTFSSSLQVLPMGLENTTAVDQAVATGAAGLIGVLSGYPSDSHDYYAPYKGVFQPIPAVWISGSEGARLNEMLTKGPLQARLRVDALRRTVTTHNVLAELPGADDELVIIGSHHDAPWASAVEDTSGIGLVLAQAEYWSRLPREERPHRLVFVLNAAHMSGGAGTAEFLRAHEADLARTVLELHLEHAALEQTEVAGHLQPTGRTEVRWWFTSRIAQLETAVKEAIEAEDLTRSLVLPPSAFGTAHPLTDGGMFYLQGVPLVNLLAAPFYLFDSQDTMDKVDREHLAAITRAAVRIIESTRGETAQSMRESVRPGF